MRYNLSMSDAVPLPDPQLLTAYHEAGHAVMAHLCGQIVTKVEIIGDDDHTGSVSCIRFHEEPQWLADENIPSAAIEARVLCLVAGIAAENIVSGDLSWHESEGDLDEAVRLALRVVGSCERVLPFLKEARDHSSDLLRRHWKAVEALAGLLLIHKSLSRDEVRQVVAAWLDTERAPSGRVA